MSDLVTSIMAYEAGEMTPAQEVHFFAGLIKTGRWRQLQGHYHRAVRWYWKNAIISVGGTILVDLEEEVTDDADRGTADPPQVPVHEL